MMKPRNVVLLTLLSLAVLGGSGGFLFMYLGVYDIGATTPHTSLFIKVITFAKERAVKMRARNIKEHNLDDAHLIEKGFHLYQDKCVACHGGPGLEATAQIQGLNPNVPPLENSIENWKAREIAWIIKNGFKMTGMPGFGLGQSSQELWALTAFVKRMNTLSPKEYAAMINRPSEKTQWLPPPQGWKVLAQRGDVERGREVLKSYGCGTCHLIPGVLGATGRVGASLELWAGRHYLAGKYVNNPINLVNWIKQPQAMESETIMPDVDVTDDDAWDMARYLFSLKGKGANSRE